MISLLVEKLSENEYDCVHEHLGPTLVSNLGSEINGFEDDLSNKGCLALRKSIDNNTDLPQNNLKTYRVTRLLALVVKKTGFS